MKEPKWNNFIISTTERQNNSTNGRLYKCALIFRVSESNQNMALFKSN
jgi:hypothetical protein